MIGNFKLNNVWYKSHGTSLPQQEVANQAAAKIGQGNSEYGDMTTWSAWTQQDWQEGVGQLRPHRGGGFLYGELESRVPEQLILPARIEQVDRETTLFPTRFMPAEITSFDTIATGDKRAMRFDVSTMVTVPTMCWFYCRAPQGTTLTLEIFDDSSGPNTLVVSNTVVVQESSPSFYWHGALLDTTGANSLGSPLDYWVAISADDDIEVAVASSGYGVLGQNYDGSSWSEDDNYTLFSTSIRRNLGGSGTNIGTGFFRFTNTTQSDLYCYVGGTTLIYDEANDQWDLQASIVGGNISSAAVFLSEVWLASDTSLDSGNGSLLQTDGTIDDAGIEFSYVVEHGGLLWIAQDNVPSYSADGTTFTTYTDMVCGPADYPITGMAGMGDSMYASNRNGLYRIAPGDFAVPVAPWGSNNVDNGRCMVNFEGSLYVTADNRIYRFSQDLQRQDIWLTREDDLIEGRLGEVRSLAVCNSWLLALVSDGGEGSKPTIWAMQGNSWHHIATLPDSPLASPSANYQLVNYAMFYDAVTDYLWVATPQRVTYRIYLPNTSINPYNDVNSEYMPYGWIEWDWFTSTILEAQKDFESVAITGENLSSDRTVAVYWQDDSSTGWELLGTIDSNFEELVWPTATRPDTKRLKLGLLLKTNDASETPRIRAIRVKYSMNIRDWFRWSLAVDVSGRTGDTQMMLDGTRNTLTASQIKSNLDALVTRTAPFVYQDVDGQAYDVRVVNATFSPTKQEYIDGTATAYWEGVYRIVVEQVRPGANA